MSVFLPELFTFYFKPYVISEPCSRKYEQPQIIQVVIYTCKTTREITTLMKVCVPQSWLCFDPLL